MCVCVHQILCMIPENKASLYTYCRQVHRWGYFRVQTTCRPPPGLPQMIPLRRVVYGENYCSKSTYQMTETQKSKTKAHTILLSMVHLSRNNTAGERGPIK